MAKKKNLKSKDYDSTSMFNVITGKQKQIKDLSDSEIIACFDSLPDFHNAVDKVAFSVATADFYIVRENSDGTEEQVRNHPLIKILKTMNTDLIGFQGLKLTQIYLDTVGRCYWKIVKRKNTNVVESIIPLNPTWVLQESVDGIISVAYPNGKTDVLQLGDTCEKLSYPSPVHPYKYSTGKGRVLSDELLTSENMSKFIAQRFAGDGLPAFILSADGLTPQETERLEASWFQKMARKLNRFKPYFMGRKVDIHEFNSDFQSLQMSDLRKFERAIIMSTYGVPPEIFGLTENSNRATSYTAKSIMAEYVLFPRLTYLKEFFIYRLAKYFGEDEDLRIEFADITPDDIETFERILSIYPTAFTQNEVRQRYKYSPVEGGNKYLIDFNKVAIDSLDSIAYENVGVSNETAPEKQFKSISKQLTEKDIDSILEELDIDMKKDNVMSREYRAVVINVIADTFKEIGFNGDPNPFSMGVTNYVNNVVGNRIVGINEVSKAKLRETLLEGLANEEALTDLTKRVSSVFRDFSKSRVKTIARTESHSSVSFGTNQAYKESGVKERMWIHHPELSSHPRDEHASMDGQTVLINEPFTALDGSVADYPSGFGIAYHDINCNCTVGAVLDDSINPFNDKAYREKYWEKKNNEVLKYEKRFDRLYRKIFNNQKNALIKSLKELQ